MLRVNLQGPSQQYCLFFVLNMNNLNIYKNHSPYNRLMLGFHNINRVMEEKNLARSVIRAVKASEWNWKH